MRDPLIINTYNSKKINPNEIKNEILTLSNIQKQCLLFLFISILSKKTCIIQGQTASGKSKLIPLIAKMLGKKLHIYQMNNDSGISILTGYNKIEDELSNEEKEDLINICKKLKEFINIEFYLEEIFHQVDYTLLL